MRAHPAPVAVIALAGMLAACASDGPTSGSGDVAVRFTVSNALVAPVNIFIDGAPYVIALANGRNTTITVSSAARVLTWTSAKPTDADARPIPDDIDEVRIALPAIRSTLEISNLINDQMYITARILNLTSSRVLIGVYNGASVSCAGLLRAASGGANGFVQIGYYRLLPATEVRAYRDGSDCTGPYVAWPRSDLEGSAVKSGLLTLSLGSAP